MNATPQSAKDDLAFMRSVVEGGDGVQRQFGESYLAAGLCYGAQMILSAGQSLAWLPTTPAWGLTIGFGPTVVFLALLVWIIRRGRRAAPTGTVGRAIASVFGCVGTANLVLIVVIGTVALRQHSFTTWLIYPCAVFVLQGAAWLVAYVLRRRFWLAVVAAGWFVTAIVMAFCVQTLAYFILSAGIGFLLLMVIPGAVILRLARASA